MKRSGNPATPYVDRNNPALRTENMFISENFESDSEETDKQRKKRKKEEMRGFEKMAEFLVVELEWDDADKKIQKSEELKKQAKDLQKQAKVLEKEGKKEKKLAMASLKAVNAKYGEK